MKGVLTVLVLVVAMCSGAAMDGGVALAANAGNSPVEQGQQPGLTPGASGADQGGAICSTDGDPDDIGGGFRSHGNGAVQGGAKPPKFETVTVMQLIIELERYWFLVLR